MIDPNVPAVLQVVIDPTKAEVGAGKVKTVVKSMTDTSLQFLQVMQNKINSSYQFLSTATSSFSSRAIASVSNFTNNASNLFSKFSSSASNSLGIISASAQKMAYNIGYGVGTATSTAIKSFAGMVAPIKSAMDSIGDSWNKRMNDMREKARSIRPVDIIGSSMSEITSLLGKVFSVELLERFVDKLVSVTDTYNAFISTVEISAGSTKAAREEYEYLYNLAQGLGVPFEQLTKSYGKFTAATKDTVLQGKGAREIFESISEVSTVLHLKGYDTERMFYAITQSISKGRLYREELVQQLGEKLPGAMKLAAKAMYPLEQDINVATAKLNKGLEKGTIDVYEFWFKLSQVLKTEYADAAQMASQLITAQINRMKNGWDRFMTEVGQNGAIEGLSKVVKAITAIFEESNKSAQVFGAKIGMVFSKIAEFIGQITTNDIANFFSGISGFIQAIALSFTTLASGMSDSNKQSSSFIGFMQGVSNAMITVSGYLTIFANGISYVYNRIMQFVNALSTLAAGFTVVQASAQLLKPTNWFDGGEKALKNIKAEMANFKKQMDETSANAINGDKAAANIDRAYATMEASLKKNNAFFASEIAKNNKLNSQAIGDIPRKQFKAPGPLAADDPLAMTDWSKGKTNAVDATAKANDIKKVASAYENLIQRLTEYNAKAGVEIDQGEKLTSGQREYLNVLQFLNENQMKLSVTRFNTLTEMAAEAYSADLLRVNYERVSDEVKKQIESYKEYQAALSAITSNMDEQIADVYKKVDATKQDISVIDQTQESLRALEIAKYDDIVASLNQALANKEVNNLSLDQIKLFETMIAKYELLKAAKSELYAKEYELAELKRTRELAKTVAAENKRDVNQLTRSITDALFRGFENGNTFAENFVQTLKNTFKTLVLRPTVEFFVEPLAPLLKGVINKAIGSIAGSLGLGGLGEMITGQKAGGLQASSGGLKDIFDVVSKGFDGANIAFEQSIQKFGTFLTDFGSVGDKIGLTKLGGVISQFSDKIAIAAGFSKPIISLLSGNVKQAAFEGAGAGIGFAIGGPVGAGIGSFLGGAVGGLFGGKKQPPRTVTQLPQVAEQFSNSLSAILKSFGMASNVTASSFYTGRPGGSGYGNLTANINGTSRVLNTKDKDAYGEASLNNFINRVLTTELVNAIRSTSLSAAIKNLFTGVTTQEAISTLIGDIITLNTVSRELNTALDITVDQVAMMATESAIAGENFTNLVGTLASVSSEALTIGDAILNMKSDLVEFLGGELPDSLASYDAALRAVNTSTVAGRKEFLDLLSSRAAFAEFDGLITGLKTNVSSGLYSIVSDAEKMAMQRAELATLFGTLNLAVPRSTQELINMGKSIDYTTVQGLNLASVFPQLVEAFTAVNGAAQQLTSTLNPDAFSRFSDFVIASSYKNAGIAIPSAYMPSYAVGTSYVPTDGPAMLHEGEAVLTKSDNASLGENTSIMVDLLGRLISDVEALKYEVKRGADSSRDAANSLDDIVEGQLIIKTEVA